jgi:hypothetical protein
VLMSFNNGLCLMLLHLVDCKGRLTPILPWPGGAAFLFNLLCKGRLLTLSLFVAFGLRVVGVLLSVTGLYSKIFRLANFVVKLRFLPFTCIELTNDLVSCLQSQFLDSCFH